MSESSAYLFAPFARVERPRFIAPVVRFADSSGKSGRSEFYASLIGAATTLIGEGHDPKEVGRILSEMADHQGGYPAPSASFADWDEGKHPRGDNGRFINAMRIAEARHDKAATCTMRLLEIPLASSLRPILRQAGFRLAQDLEYVSSIRLREVCEFFRLIFTR